MYSIIAKDGGYYVITTATGKRHSLKPLSYHIANGQLIALRIAMGHEMPQKKKMGYHMMPNGKLMAI